MSKAQSMVIVLYVTIIFTSFISLLWPCIVFLRGRTAERRSGLRKAQESREAQEARHPRLHPAARLRDLGSYAEAKTCAASCRMKLFTDTCGTSPEYRTTLPWRPQDQTSLPCR